MVFIIKEQLKFPELGEDAFFKILSKRPVKGGNIEAQKKELIEYLKRKAGIPQSLLDPAYDSVVPYPYNDGKAPQGSPAIATGSTDSQSQKEKSEDIQVEDAIPLQEGLGPIDEEIAAEES